MSVIAKWVTRLIAFLVLSYLVAISGALRPLVNSIYIPFTDFITRCAGTWRDARLPDRLDNNLIVLYFLFSAITAVLLIAFVEWSIRQVSKNKTIANNGCCYSWHPLPIS